MTLKVALAAVTALALTVPAAAMAAPVPEGSAEVRFGDLNLSTAKGFSDLTRRIDKAADQICGTAPRDLASKAANSECRAEVAEQAHAKLRDQLTSSPLLVAQR